MVLLLTLMAEDAINQGLQDLSWPARQWRSMQRALMKASLRATRHSLRGLTTSIHRRAS